MSGITGTFTDTGTSGTIQINRLATLSISGISSSTVELQRTFDGGDNWNIVESFTEDTEVNVEGTGERYRLECSTHGTGTITYYLGN